MKQTDWECKVDLVASELFRLAEWIAVIALFVVAGSKLDHPLVQGFGYFLWMLASLYLGVRTDTLIAYARYGDQPRKYSVAGALWGVLVAGTFGLAVGALVESVAKATA